MDERPSGSESERPIEMSAEEVEIEGGRKLLVYTFRFVEPAKGVERTEE